MTRATNGASAALTWPVPQPRSPTVQSLSASAASAARWKRSPNSSSRTRSHWPAEEEKNSCDLVRRSASAACSRRWSWAAAGVGPDLLAHQQPEPPRGGVEVVAASSCRGCSCLRRATPTQPASASALRCRLTVDCGSCMTAHSSDTVSSCRSSSSRMRLRVVSASEARWSRMAGRAFVHPSNRMKGYNTTW